MALPPREVGKVSSVANQTASGVIGTASIDTDVRAIAITQTTTGLTFTLPSPSDTSVVVGLDIVNIGTAAFVMYGQSVLPNSTIRTVWSASAWIVPTSINPPAYTVANLPATGNSVGQTAYATNGRALAGGALAALYFQAAGAGTGCLVTWNGSVWQVAGTNSTVAA